jgi:hypothetical protein
MLQSQARGYLADLRGDIARRGYDQADKRHLAIMFGDLRVAYTGVHRHAPFSGKRLREITALEQRWQKDRRNAVGGANTISQILAEIEQYIPDLPAEVKSDEIKTPTLAETQANSVLDVLRKRGLTVSAA